MYLIFQILILIAQQKIRRKEPFRDGQESRQPGIEKLIDIAIFTDYGKHSIGMYAIRATLPGRPDSVPLHWQPMLK